MIEQADGNSFPSTADILQLLLDGKRIVFFITLFIRTATSIFLGEFTSVHTATQPASRAELSVIQLLDALQASGVSAAAIV